MRLLLGAKHKVPAEALRAVRTPCFASPKVDGWRGFWQGQEFFTRNGNTIPNRALQRLAREFNIPPGYDGEIIVGEPNAPDCFRRTDSFCKTINAPLPQDGVYFFVFDHAGVPGGFRDRIETVFDMPPFVVKLPQAFLGTTEMLEVYEAECVAQGFEGICTRAPNGPYKQGRSTMKEQYLVKVKRYIDEEVRVTGYEELHHNANPATLSATGYSKRSSHQEGKVAAGVLGSLIIDWRGKELHVGTGFDWEDRVNIWSRRDYFLGKLVTIRYSPPTKDLPRQPVFKGFRGDL